MRFDLDEDVALLKQSTRELLERESPLTGSRALMEDSEEGYSKALYAQLAELGYLGLALPEEAGGAGIGHVALAAVLEEMGRVAFPGPFLDQVIAISLLHAAGAGPAAQWLARAVAGEALVVAARGEELEPVEADPPRTRFEAGRVRGTKHFVPFGAGADALLVTAAEGLVLAPRPGDGWRARRLETLDHAQRFAELELDQPGELLAEGAAARALLNAADRVAALGAAACLLGLMQRALETTVSYTKQRQAFGAPIASFQALQHRAADMLVRTEASRAAVYRAAWLADADPPAAPLAIAAAKAYAGDAARLVCGEAIQMHGGVGFTWEYDPHVYFKRVKTLEQFHGSTAQQIEAALRAAGV
jgi:alkylation response protein AidB-like acyl-CoA dehydrogenase